MSDSVDRVFVHALATVRRLPRTGSSRPPPSSRLRLYGLYKQSMEGDVSAILPRPTLPVASPNPNDPSITSVHRYGSRDLRTRETQAEIEKWDAWHACEGMSSTEAKRRYISILIDTMKEYASGTSESRELVSELEFVWNQIKSQSGSDESEEGESPTRRLERAGMKRTDAERSKTNIIPSGPGRGGDSVNKDRGDRGELATGSSLFGFTRMQTNNSGSNTASRHNSQSEHNGNRRDSRQSQTQSQSKRPRAVTTASGLRILSPMSQDGSDAIVENEELPQLEPEAEPESESSSSGQQDDDDLASPTEGPQPTVPVAGGIGEGQKDPWRLQIEAHLSRLTLELTALREQLSSHSLLSRSSFAHPMDFSLLSFRKRLYYNTTGWVQWALGVVIKQLIVQFGLLTVVLLYGRWKGDRRMEEWVRKKVKEVRLWISKGGLLDMGWRRWKSYLRVTI